MPRSAAAPLVPLALLALSATALGHGGQYTAPRVPLGPVTGVDPADAGRFSAPPTGGPPTTIGPGGVLRRATTEDGGGWRTWWRARGPTMRAERDDQADGGMAELTGRARDAAADWAPVRELLQRALRDPQIDVVDSAILARGRSASPASGDDVFKELWPFVGHPVESIRRSAVAALGLVESDRVLPVLVSQLHQPRQTDPITNGIAAIALGYQSAPEGIAALERAIDRGEPEDTVCAAIVGLGLYRESRREIVLFLLDKLDDATLSSFAEAQIPIALGRLGDEAVPAIPALEELAGRGGAPLLQRAAIIALGRLLTPEDDDAVLRLVLASDRSRHGDTRGAALLSLGEIARRARPDDERAAAGAARAREQLLRRLTAPMHRADLGFTALAVARSVAPLPFDHEDRVTATERLERLLRERRSDPLASAVRGGAAVALGLLGDEDVASELRAWGEQTSDASLCADLATAMGLLGDAGAMPLLRRWIERTDDARLREAAIEALGTISREVATTVLLRRLDDAGVRPGDRILVVQGLARIGGPSAMPRLIRLAEDEESDPLTRAFAVVTLGRMLERSRPAWNERLATDADPHTQCRPVRELLDLF